MRTLLVLRHAKAQRDAPRGDRRRRLTGRGKRDARAIGTVVAALDRPLDLIVTSDADRADQTARAVAAAVGGDVSVEVDPDLYDADVAALLDLVRALPDEARTVVVVGHNPGFEQLVDILTGPPTVLDRLPTAGLAYLELDVASWGEVGPGVGRLTDIQVGRGS